MDYKISHSSGGYLVELSGKMTYQDANKTDAILNELKNKSSAAISFDMSRVEHMDSTALGFLVHVYDIAKERGVPLTLKKPQPMVRKLLENAAFEKILDVE